MKTESDFKRHHVPLTQNEQLRKISEGIFEGAPSKFLSFNFFTARCKGAGGCWGAARTLTKSTPEGLSSLVRNSFYLTFLKSEVAVIATFFYPKGL